MNIIRDGIIMMVYEFIVIIAYVTLSSPVATTIGAIVDAGVASGVTQLTSYETLVSNVITICFALLGIIPLVWFIFRVYSREQDWGYRYE